MLFSLNLCLLHCCLIFCSVLLLWRDIMSSLQTFRSWVASSSFPWPINCDKSGFPSPLYPSVYLIALNSTLFLSGIHKLQAAPLKVFLLSIYWIDHSYFYLNTPSNWSPSENSSLLFLFLWIVLEVLTVGLWNSDRILLWIPLVLAFLLGLHLDFIDQLDR